MSTLTFDVHAQQAERCPGSALNGIRGLSAGRLLEDGAVLGRAKVNINIDGYAKAYHPENANKGALIHLCNAGQVFLPNGTSYHGSVDNPTCTGRFMRDFARIGAAGWKDPTVGVIRWYGILGKDEAHISGKAISGVVPVFQADGSGYFVSPTALADETIRDASAQHRYVNPLRIPAAVIPQQQALSSRGVVLGSFGVAYDSQHDTAVPFVVGDIGPRIGEASTALARALAGLPITDDVTRSNRYAGQVDEPRVIWIFFGERGGKASYDSSDEQALRREARSAFERWGGRTRLLTCADR